MGSDRNRFNKKDWENWLVLVKDFLSSSKKVTDINELLVEKPFDNRPYISVPIVNQTVSYTHLTLPTTSRV